MITRYDEHWGAGNGGDTDYQYGNLGGDGWGETGDGVGEYHFVDRLDLDEVLP